MKSDTPHKPFFNIKFLKKLLTHHDFIPFIIFYLYDLSIPSGYKRKTTSHMTTGQYEGEKPYSCRQIKHLSLGATNKY